MSSRGDHRRPERDWERDDRDRDRDRYSRGGSSGRGRGRGGHHKDEPRRRSSRSRSPRRDDRDRRSGAASVTIYHIYIYIYSLSSLQIKETTEETKTATTAMTTGDTENGTVIRIETGGMEGMADEETSVSILVATEEVKDVKKNRELFLVHLLKLGKATPLWLHNHHLQPVRSFLVLLVSQS